MAIGDKFIGLEEVADGAYLDIQPASGVEAVIHNIYYDGPVSVALTDGTLTLAYDSDTAAGAREGYVGHVTEGIWLRVTNTSGDSSTIRIGFSGVVTKEAS